MCGAGVHQGPDDAGAPPGALQFADICANFRCRRNCAEAGHTEVVAICAGVAE